MNEKKRRTITKANLLQFLEESNTILKSVIDSPKNVVVFALDIRYRYLAFNKFHYEIMKQIWDVEIVLGNNMLDYIKRADDRKKAKKNFDRALTGESFVLEEKYGDTTKKRRYYENNYNPIINESGKIIGLTLILTDITKRKKIESERDKLINELQNALAKVKQLSGLIPVCSSCKKIRDDNGYWNQLESYIEQHSDASFSHGLCPECSDKFYGDKEWYIKMKKKSKK